ncbi:hypothetical protein Tsubulata_045229, partial [Turnera subulata]
MGFNHSKESNRTLTKLTFYHNLCFLLIMAQPSGAPSPYPIAIIGSQYCAPYPIDLAIVRKIMTIADGNFAVTDMNGSVIFTVKEKLLTFLHERMTIRDAAGNPIVTLRKKAMTAHSRWQAFRGDSIEAKDLLFDAKTHSMFQLKTKLDVFLANNTDQRRSCVVYAGDEHSNTVVAQMHKKHSAASILLGKDHFSVTVYPNIDYAFIVALIVILDDINHASKDAGSSGGWDFDIIQLHIYLISPTMAQATNAIISPQYRSPHPIELAIVTKIVPFAGSYLQVKDPNGNIIFTVKYNRLVWLHGYAKTIFDAAGNPVVTLRRKSNCVNWSPTYAQAMTLHSRWKAFRGDGKDSKDLLFRVNMHSVFNMSKTLDVFLANNTAKEVCDFKVKASLSSRSCTVYAGDEGSSTTAVVAQMHKQRTSLFFGRIDLMINVYPNVDYAFIVALMVILDDIGSSD